MSISMSIKIDTKANLEALKSLKSGFKSLRDQIQEIVELTAQGLKISVNDLDASAVGAALQGLMEQVGGTTATIAVDADTGPARSAVSDLLAWINSQRATISVFGEYRGTRGVPAGVPGFRTGGVLGGYGGGDRINARLEPGEGILTKEAVRLLGPSWVLGMNELARNGARLPRAPRLAVPTVPRFQDGGIAEPVMRHEIKIGNRTHTVRASRDAVVALINDLTKVGRAS